MNTTIKLSVLLRFIKRIDVRIQTIHNKIKEYNCAMVSFERPGEIRSMYAESEQLQLRLIQLKGVRNRANETISLTLLEMEELERTLKFLRNIPVNPGDRQTCIINSREREELIEKTQHRLHEIQDLVDAYNSSTDVEVVMDLLSIT